MDRFRWIRPKHLHNEMVCRWADENIRRQREERAAWLEDREWQKTLDRRYYAEQERIRNNRRKVMDFVMSLKPARKETVRYVVLDETGSIKQTLERWND